MASAGLIIFAIVIVAWGIGMVYESAVLSHVGCGRKNNEDNYY